MDADQKQLGPVPGGPTPMPMSAGGVDGGDHTGTVSGSAFEPYRVADVKLQDPVVLSDKACARMLNTLSHARLRWYLDEAEGDARLALRLHAWNEEVGATLLPILQKTEVVARNFAVGRLISRYGKRWYSDERLERVLGKSKRAEELRETVRKQSSDGHIGNLTNQITNELTFGFWVNVYTKSFGPVLWTAALHTMNPSIPRSVDIVRLHEGVDFVRTFRNNVTHTKNLVRKPTDQHFDRTLEVLGWLCRDSATMVRNTSRFHETWNCRPK